MLKALPPLEARGAGRREADHAPQQDCMDATLLRPLLIFLHLAGAIAWLGGMFFAHFCLRPAALAVLAPPQRLPLWSATLGRFLPYMAVAVLVILTSGFILFLDVGFRHAPPGWHAMLALGLVMAAVFARVYLALYPQLRARCAAADWPAAAQVLDRIRRLVGLNLVLGLGTVMAAVSAR